MAGNDVLGLLGAAAPLELELETLRAKREFGAIVARAGVMRDTKEYSPKIRCLAGQALIECGRSADARVELLPLIDDERSPLRDEALGLVGRSYKQDYVDGIRRGQRDPDALLSGFKHYERAFNRNQQLNFWQGINCVALGRRAQRDGIRLDWPDLPDDMNQIVIDAVQRVPVTQMSPWHFATLAEARLARSDVDQAEAWLRLYAADPRVDAFALAGTYRQLSEVWQLDHRSGPGQRLLPVLEEKLFLDRAELRQRFKFDINVPVPRAPELQALDGAGLEAMFGSARPRPLEWLDTVKRRARFVGRVLDTTGHFVGTCFVVRGGDLHRDLAGRTVLLTNYHVINSKGPDGFPGAVKPNDARIQFERRGDQRHKVGKLYWESPFGECDAAVLDFPLEGRVDLPLTEDLKPLEPACYVYVLGHPAGMNLSLSLDDNALLDHDDAWLHYRNPTAPGSSGSPVFDDQLRLVGIHHRGTTTMPRLNGKEGTYEANEGAWIRNVRLKLAAHFSKKSPNRPPSPALPRKRGRE